MVNCKLLGGIGNCLFIIAATIAYSLKNKITYSIPSQIDNPHYEGQKVFYSKYIRYCEVTNEEPDFNISHDVYVEPYFHYKEIPRFSDFAVDVLTLRGYFQSWRYFNEYRNEILKILDIPYEFKKDWCSIHVRRGDYLNLPNIHPAVTSEYLINAIAKIFNLTNCKNFLVFGDDVEWNKEYFRNIFAYDETNKEKTEINFEFSENKTDVEDLSLASSCEHFLGCNSSYSWWIYYLNRNENKIGVFPQKTKWFGKDLPHNVDDLYMPQWTLI